jgi:iron-sulfur cluster assembly protein
MTANDGTPQEQATAGTQDGQAKLVVAQRAKAVPASEGLVLSEKAAEKVREHIARAGLPVTTYLYVGVKGGGCSGLQYVLDLRDEVHAPIHDTDEVFASQGIHIVCDLKSFVVGNLGGTTIDWQETMMGAGFAFNNPNARHTCGCGGSYSA